MEEKKFSLRQKWFPTIDDAERIQKERFRRKGEPFHYLTGFSDFFGRWIRTLAVGSVFLWTTCNGIGNNIEYSQGQRVGVINKISEKGIFWKTKEGQLSLEGRTSTGEYTGAGVWNFSIDRTAKRGENVDSLYNLIKQYMEEGQRVKLTYDKDLAVWPWRAGTRSLVQEVEPLEDVQKR